MPFGQAQDSRGRSCAERYGELLNYLNENDDNDDEEVYKIMCGLLQYMR